MPTTYHDLAKMIDHALLSPTLSVADFESGIQLAIDYQVASVCTMPSFFETMLGIVSGDRRESFHRDRVSSRWKHLCDQKEPRLLKRLPMAVKSWTWSSTSIA